MKGGCTHLAHKLEQAVDLESGAVVGMTVQTMDGGDVASLGETLDEAVERLVELGGAAAEIEHPPQSCIPAFRAKLFCHELLRWLRIRSCRSCDSTLSRLKISTEGLPALTHGE